MSRRLKAMLIAAGVVAVLGVGGVAIAVAGGGDDDGSEKPITGQALEKASAAALESTGGGRVTETEVGDEEGYYEVEVTLQDGRQVDVHLDRDFKVSGQAADSDNPDD
jgi:Peptidase propeptide and YPEB domain